MKLTSSHCVVPSFILLRYLKFSKIIIIKIIELISSELHNFGASEIIFHGSYFCRRENDFPLFCLLCHLSKSEVEFLRSVRG